MAPQGRMWPQRFYRAAKGRAGAADDTQPVSSFDRTRARPGGTTPEGVIDLVSSRGGDSVRRPGGSTASTVACGSGVQSCRVAHLLMRYARTKGRFACLAL